LLAVALWVVASRALRPLEQTARAMDNIGVGDLTARIPSPTPDDELGRMVASLNRLLDRLAGGVTEMRRFTADAAHELRTPLAVLRTGLEVTLARERAADEYRTALTEALRDTEHLARLAEDLLTLARLEGLPSRAPNSPIGLAEMLQELADAWEEAATARGVGIDVAGDPTLSVDGIAPELYRLFGNLIENALHHTASGTRIEITMRRDGDWARVCVIDGGLGLATDQLERVFERFYRAPGTKAPGTGLGLSIARAIARAHQGDVKLWNHSRGGCVAEVSLPLGGAAERGARAVSTSDS
ncbi:MAG: sensor histidine kinase, partial [Candidatus Binatia bacterium]